MSLVLVIYIVVCAVIIVCAILNAVRTDKVKIGGYNIDGNPADVKFTIDKCEVVFDSEGKKVVKYTAHASFYKRKNGNGFEVLYVTFYGEQGEYNVGNILTLREL